MAHIRFLVTRTVQDGSGTTFEAGQVYDLPAASAERWLRRGVAEPAVEPTPVPAQARANRPPASPAPVAPLASAKAPAAPTTD